MGDKSQQSEIEQKYRELEARYRHLKAFYDLEYRAKLANYKPPPLKYTPGLSRNYMDMLLAPEKTALIIIDMVNEFCSPYGQMYLPSSENIIPNINRLVDYFRNAEIPIIWVKGVMEPDFSNRGLMEWRYLRGLHKKPYTDDSWESQFHEELNGPIEGDIIIKKHRYDAFAGSYINSTLKYFGIESLVFTGVATTGCVGAAARHAFSEDYNVVLVSDGTGTRSVQYQELFLEETEIIWARVLTTDEVIAELKALALPPGFKSTYSKRKAQYDVAKK